MNEERREVAAREAAAVAAREAAAVAAQQAPQNIDDRPAQLFVDQDLTGYRTRWSAIQTGFVDEPRRAVEEADALVNELMTRLTQTFADERRTLEAQWGQSDKVSTEDLRIAMRRYRSFFERLLSI